ncbi:PREDICTED: protein bark beetle isoform X1 [Rhagoletis zephyria]|uniref:protein bark beetle isoform X1 n=1 Tax=Rhagoletis zephyria TaxID=28612 RepID=UPI000811AA29|nr:PREDICTED: protein bark beetle isoform X1 [Rhagoletis zephyria]XP_017468950.1 PREDICTED: protein bark beetle isoform X1 [Rhagoletis zephyria]XP_017468951.1 PREDICTED: protein bark beetle isoform X1 [Rhagoletis zephyria]XP_017468952.1 PREDICTED: protein bark beetle isoform X1 [Rhagoletis zephyria]XP_017468953.1 PREDICTED: protein bark beetle isoform X1 [Rhagoletis zephyria]XP_017468954.1 PREDICTED: protein bark beetle isoform X1 [Rhagoletis zephyria]
MPAAKRSKHKGATTAPTPQHNARPPGTPMVGHRLHQVLPSRLHLHLRHSGYTFLWLAALCCVAPTSTYAQLQGNTLVGGGGVGSPAESSSEIEFASLDGAGTQLLTPLLPAPSTVAPPLLEVVEFVEPAPAQPVMSSPTLSSSSLSAAAAALSYTELQGGEINGERTLRFSESPFLARHHIEVARGARLIIEPGVRVEFAPTVGITVRGVLHAVGTPTSRITLTAQALPIATQTDIVDAEVRGARLVDGPTPLEGRLQLYHKGAWRDVCTNSRNWTLVDYAVACRQMGFTGGRFWNWVERTPGYHPRLLFEQPRCKGGESTLLSCAWATRQLGSGVCDYHNDIGVQCQAVHNAPMSYWRGLYFENAPATKTLGNDNIVYTALSRSTLRYVDITRAGVGRENSVKSAVEAIGLPPVMQHVVISHSAYTGFNATLPRGGFVMQNVTVRKNNGIGVFVNSSQGMVQLEGCNILENVADGVKYVGHDLRANERMDRAAIYDFCTLPTTSGQTYPITLSFTQKYYAGSEKLCGKYFFTRPGYLLTVHFESFDLRNNETATVEIFDGTSDSDRVLFAWKARNYTRPQSVTSNREKLFIRIRADARQEVNGFLRLTSDDTRAYDLRVANSVVEDNGGRGIAIDNIRSKLHVHGSYVSGNGHVSGVHVTSGAGDVNITSSNITFNQGGGVNITYYGGNRNISRSAIQANKGYGIAVWLNDTSAPERIEYIPFNQTTTVEYSQIGGNLETGVFHGNYCQPIWVNITGNSFNGSLHNDVFVESCWRFTANKEPNMQLQIGHNTFDFSQKNSIFLSPALNLQGKIEFNHFRLGTYGAIYIRNDYIYQEFNFMPVRMLIQSNHFRRNSGVYVVSLGLSPYSTRELQSLLFTRNFVRDNKISEPFGPLIEGSEGSDGSGRLNPRCRVAAAVVVASSNVDIYRNILHNLDSAYEVGSQLSDQSQIINATYNWLGHSDEYKIFARLFHRNNRYNLAKIQYIPYLLHSSNPGSTTIITMSTLVPRFSQEGSDLIGGEIDGQEILSSGTYRVTKDINIRPGGKLTLQPGVTLRFEPSVGMMVAGKLEARGRRPDDIFFTLKRETVITMDNTTDVDQLDVDIIDIETESIIEKNEPPRMPVRLVGGAGDYEGRLQVYLDGRWGTVCDYGWTVLNAALVCHHLGYTLNPRDWRLHRSQMPTVGVTEDVIVSNMRCTEHDTDITKCRAEYATRGEFENSCSHDNDVGMRCYEGAWAGLRFSMLAERADLQYLTIEKAGLFDYTTNVFKPAIQMDFARHNLENVRVVDNLQDGLGVVYADIYGGKSVNNIKNCEFVGNRGNGISLKQLDLRIQGSIIKNNRDSGISHDPVISAVEQNELGGWFKMAVDFNSFEADYDPYVLPRDEGQLDLDTWQNKYIRTEPVRGESVSRKIVVRCPAGYVLGIQLLNPIQNLSTEHIAILDSQTENRRSELWQLKRDLNVFPTTSSSYGIIIYYESGENALGGTVLRLSTVTAPVQNIRNRVVSGPVPTLSIRSTKIQKNFRGIAAYYYNRYVGDNGEYYLRKANESMKIVNSEISSNLREAILVKSPFWDVQYSNISEVTIHVNSSMITQNGHGIRQLSKDLRSSNNLFHYVVQDTTVEDNAFGGFQVALPYVWQYNENFTHSVYFGNSTWQRNRNFFIDVSGHYTVFNITSNVFLSNQCPRSLITLDGMEKRIKFDYNRIESNNAKFIMELRADSLSEILGEVPALIAYNTIKGNSIDTMAGNFRNAPMRRYRPRKVRPQNRLPSAVIRLDGIQNVKLYRNLIAENQMDYNLVAGVRSARLNNYFHATENWWGSNDAKFIESKIFDFDTWNDHADVIYQPFLIEDSFDASVSLVDEHDAAIDLDFWTGGRVYKDLTLRKRAEPYRILADITVMPGVTLSIQHGVQLEFEPNVGILVLGTLLAVGYRESEIIMRPFFNTSHEAYTLFTRRAIEDLSQTQAYDSIRLCTSAQNCTANPQLSLDGISEGFLEYFNHTTLQWVPICDSRFTERNAQVVCRELGFDPLNVYYGHDRRIEYHTNSLTRIWTWVQPLECRGDELRMEDCAERLNGQVYGRRHECRWDDVFVFVSCNSAPEDQVYWGGIRFANADFEENQYGHRFHDTLSHGPINNRESNLEYVRIENAGILHNQKSAAIQAIHKNPTIRSVTIVNSAHHGVNYIAPSGTMNLNLLNISNAFGAGINILSLTGEGRESDESSFTPLKDLDIPNKLFSLVDICDPQKVLTVEERMLVYYKYDNNAVNCVKIFTSLYRAKPIGFRLLQSNLFNHSKEYGRMDVIRLFDGDIYNVTAHFLGKIEWDSGNQRKFFKTESPTLSLQLIASGAPEYHGFIAEIVTVPISSLGQFRDALHNITYSHISGAVKGAVTYASAGEVSPTLTLTSNRIQRNCHQLYGNFSTCKSALSIDVQNMHSLYFMNNLVMDNQGGLSIRADSRGSATSLRGFIHHNLFFRNRNRPALYVEGRQSSPYQEIELYRNYFAQNKAGFEDIIKLRQVVSNFSYNFVHSNVGGRIVEISGFEKVRLPIYQTTSHNGFYSNVATNWMGRATIVAGTAGQQYVDNIFENPENDYEMITVNNSILNVDYVINSTIELWRSKIDARHNYWSYNNTISVQSRIRDKSDDPLLLEVQAVPFQMNNLTILDGKCPPGWALLQDTCFIYVGAPLTFHEARAFCRSENSTMPFIRTDSTTLWKYLQAQMRHLKYPEKVWIQDFNHIDRCTSFAFTTTEVEDCGNEFGFICETDPRVVIDPLSWRADIFAISIISAFILAIILLLMVAFCWYAKSKQRHAQRLQRRNSIRQSLRSLNSIDPQGSLRRRNFNMSTSTGTLSKQLGQDYKMMGNGSIDSMDKSVLSSEASFEAYDNQTAHPSEYQKPSYNDYVTQHSVKGGTNGAASKSNEPYKIATIGSVSKASTARGRTPRLPDSFELSYRNEGFRDNSTYASTLTTSVATSIAEDTPIIHQTDIEDANSDYYGNASTLPLHSGGNESLSFLRELKQNLPPPAYNKPHGQSHSSFLPGANGRTTRPTSSSQLSNDSHSSTLPYEQKIDNLQFTPVAQPVEEMPLFRHELAAGGLPTPPPDMRRPDSYYTAVRSSKAPPPNAKLGGLASKPQSMGVTKPMTAAAKNHGYSQNGSQNGRRPKTVYKTASPEPTAYHRSRSEALLETDFDDESPSMVPLSTNSRSYSQPLETAM